MTKRLRTWLVGGLAAAAAFGLAAPAVADPTTPPVTTLPPTPPEVAPGHVRPMWHMAPQPEVSPMTIGQPGGYDSESLRAYLGLSGTGKGQRVAIVEAWDVSVAATKAVAKYNDWYGLKPACTDTVTTGCFDLTFISPDGTRPPSTQDELASILSFIVETEMDVQAVHAIAPDADITVVQATDNTEEAMMSAVDHAASLRPAVISNSYGEPEHEGEQALDGHCQAPGALCVFSSGDGGNPGQYPAANPGVLAVGGTTLDLSPTGKVRSETAWLGSGGGISPYEPQPAYQRDASPYREGRGIPDVSFDADPQSGFATYMLVEVAGFPLSIEGWSEIGGTSLGAPAWAAIIAIADQQRAARGRPPLTTADVHAAVYSKRALADITVGANGICGPICTAGPGYDLVTGMGSPRAGIDTYLARY